MDIDSDHDHIPEIFEKMDIDMDKSEEMELESEEQDKSEEIEDTRPIQKILSELAQQAQNSLNTYNNAVTRLEAILKSIDNSKEIHIKVCGIKRKFHDYIEDCALKSTELIKKEKRMNFGELLLKGLEEVISM